MKDDLIKRLRDESHKWRRKPLIDEQEVEIWNHICLEAASRIEALESQLAEERGKHQ